MGALRGGQPGLQGATAESPGGSFEVEGLVSIEGEVMTDNDREQVEQVAREIDGVRAIDLRLHVQQSPFTGDNWEG